MHTEIVAPVRRAPRKEGTETTIEEWLAAPEETRAELIGGRLVHQAMPGLPHGQAQLGTGGALRDLFGRRPGGEDRPGGWWISAEVDMHLGGIGCRPDIVGWRRDRFPRLPRPDARGLVVDVPDWICEVLSPSTLRRDWGDKRRAYHRAGVPFYWLLDPDGGMLTVLQRQEEGYLVALVAEKGEAVRAPPFEAVELQMSALLGQEDEEEPPPAEAAEPAPEPTP